MSTIAVSDDSFEADVLNASTPVLVDFWAEWCGPCKQIGPYLEELAKEFDGQITIAKVNIDDNPMAPGKYNVRAIPTMIIFNKGEEASRQVGAMTKSKIEDWIREAVTAEA